MTNRKWIPGGGEGAGLPGGWIGRRGRSKCFVGGVSRSAGGALLGVAGGVEFGPEEVHASPVAGCAAAYRHVLHDVVGAYALPAHGLRVEALQGVQAHAVDLHTEVQVWAARHF